MPPLFLRPEVKRPKNYLLASIPPEEYERIRQCLEPVSLKFNEILYECAGPAGHVFFPEGSLIALFSDTENGHRLCVATVGSHGMTGTSLAFGVGISDYTAVVPVAGNAMRMGAEAFLEEFNRGGPFREIVLKYIHYRLFVMSQNAVCHRFHVLHERLARLLLTIHDEVGVGEVLMTHDFMAQVLGVARSEVTKATGAYRTAGAIKCGRGKLRIRDLHQLGCAACECYRAVQEKFAHLFPTRTEIAAAAARHFQGWPSQANLEAQGRRLGEAWTYPGSSMVRKSV